MKGFSKQRGKNQRLSTRLKFSNLFTYFTYYIFLRNFLSRREWIGLNGVAVRITCHAGIFVFIESRGRK